MLFFELKHAQVRHAPFGLRLWHVIERLQKTGRPRSEQERKAYCTSRDLKCRSSEKRFCGGKGSLRKSLFLSSLRDRLFIPGGHVYTRLSTSVLIVSSVCENNQRQRYSPFRSSTITVGFSRLNSGGHDRTFCRLLVEGLRFLHDKIPKNFNTIIGVLDIRLLSHDLFLVLLG